MSIIGSGIDIVSIRRLEKKVSRNSAFLNRILTAGEVDYCRGRKNFFEHAAGRVALKEAAYKALKDHGIVLLWRDMEIESSGSSPAFSRNCSASEKLSKENINYSFSIAHERNYAVGSAIFWGAK